MSGTKQPMTLVVVSLAFAFGAIAGCASSPKRAEMLLDDVRGYHDGLRWHRLNLAVLRIAPPEREEFMAEREELVDDLRISDYEIVRVHYREKGVRAQVTVRYTWFLDSRGLVHRTTARELWERRGKRWLVVEEHRLRGKPMPGLAEAPEEPDEEDNAEVESSKTAAVQ